MDTSRWLNIYCVLPNVPRISTFAIRESQHYKVNTSIMGWNPNKEKGRVISHYVIPFVPRIYQKLMKHKCIHNLHWQGTRLAPLGLLLGLLLLKIHQKFGGSIPLGGLISLVLIKSSKNDLSLDTGPPFPSGVT